MQIFLKRFKLVAEWRSGKGEDAKGSGVQGGMGWD